MQLEPVGLAFDPHPIADVLQRVTVHSQRDVIAPFIW